MKLPLDKQAHFLAGAAIAERADAQATVNATPQAVKDAE